MLIYEQDTATDREISMCEGNYIGCEMCKFKKRCRELSLDEMINILKISKECVSNSDKAID